VPDTVTSPATATSALDALVAAHQRALWRYLRLLGARGNEVDELLQDTFVVAWQQGVPAGAAAGAFLRGIARNLWLRSRRAWARRREAAVASAVEALWVATVRGDDDGGDTVEALRACMAQLAERPRRALERLYGDGMPRRDVARELGMKDNGVKMLLQRTRQALRECIERRRT